MTAIELLKPHRHAGRDYLAGQTLRLAPHKADWRISGGSGGGGGNGGFGGGGGSSIGISGGRGGQGWVTLEWVGGAA